MTDIQQPNEQTADVQSDTQETVSETTQLEALIAQIDALSAEVKEAKESAARANAESYNAQKPMEQATDKAKKFALQKFAKDLLDVVDNLERGLDAAQKAGADSATIEGLQLTQKSLLTVLERHGVMVVNPEGEKFNPDFHEAVGISPDTPADTVGVVLQKGYVLHGRSIRPAMVMVGQ